MKNSFIYTSVIGILIIFNGILIFQNNSLKNTSISSQNPDDNLRFLEKLDEGTNIDKNMVLYDENNDKIKFNEVISKGKKIVLYYNAYNCNSCVENIYRAVINFQNDSIDLTNIISIVYGNTDLIKLRSKEIKNIKLYLTYKPLGLTLENENNPFFFIIDSTYIAKMFFVPNQFDLNSTQAYFNIVKKRFN